MKNQKKQKYVPCEVNVIKFNVEQGFAASPTQESRSFYGALATSQNTQTITLNQTKDNGTNDVVNDHYGTGIEWFQ